MILTPSRPRPRISSVRQGLLGPASTGSVTPMPPIDYRTGTQQPSLSIKQQLGSWKGWNYAFGHRKATVCPTVFPEIGRPRKLRRGEQRLSQEKRNWLVQSVGVYLENDQTWEAVPNHPLLALLRKPTPERDACWTQFGYEFFMYLELCGEVWIWKVPSMLRSAQTGRYLPAALWIVPNDLIQPIYDRNMDEVTEYEIMSTSGQAIYNVPAEQMIRARWKHPLNKNAAFSPSNAIAPWLMSSEAVDNSQYLSFSTDIMSQWGAMLDPDFYPEPDANKLDRLRQAFMGRLAGMANRGIALIPPGVKDMKRLANKPTEMDYRDSDASLRDKIGAVRGMNKFSIGVSDDMNRGDTQEVQTAFWRMVGDPANCFFGDLLTTQLASDYEEGLFVAFPSGCPVDQEQRRLQQVADFQCGARTPDEIRDERGLQPFGIPQSETGYVQSSLVPIDPEAMPEPEPVPDQLMGDGEPTEGMEANDEAENDAASDT